jgi:3-hydroxybutyrate dehydrogenase
MKRLSNKTAYITGASRGIGLEIANRFAEEGANLFLTARSEDALKAAKEQLSRYGNEIHVCALDVSKQTAVQKSVEEAISSFGNIDILVNNAGIHKVGGFLEHSLEEFDQIMKVNLYGVFHVCQSVIPVMKSQGHGKVINIASTAGKAASRNQSAYNTSKHAVVGLTRCLALEMASYHINVNAICPGFVETDLVSSFTETSAKLNQITQNQVYEQMLNVPAQKRILQPAEIASLAAYLASEESVGITGQAISIDGGYQFF